jgi:hypothetical protein
MATSHGGHGLISLLERYEWETSPCDFEIFTKLKEVMSCIRYNDLKELEFVVVARMEVLEIGCQESKIDDLPKV